MSKELITKETMETMIEGVKSITGVAAGVGAELINETINLFILESVLGILKFASVFVVFFIVNKYINAMVDNESKAKDKSIAKSFKTSALILSIIFFTTKSFPHIENIGKALVSPTIFLAQKTLELKKRVE